MPRTWILTGSTESFRATRERGFRVWPREHWPLEHCTLALQGQLR